MTQPMSTDPLPARLRRGAPLLLGGIAAWCLVWLFMGSATLIEVYRQPHPWIKVPATMPVLLYALVEWMVSALLVYAILGLVTVAAFRLLARANAPGPGSFRTGLQTGLGTALWFHGVLYLMVPTGMNSLPGLRYLPIGLVLLGLLGGGGWLLWRALGPQPGRARAWVLLAWVVLFTALVFTPHDLIRRWRVRQDLDAAQPRLILVSFDALRKDTLERLMPQWKLPEEALAITAFPATRLAWNALLGADPDLTFRTNLVPPLWEVRHPEHLTLLVRARAARVRTAFAIDDSLSPSFGLQPNLFNTVREPAGGWKYWLTYGHGTCWPAYSWAQNYFSPIETTNPWNDSSAWFRDLDRLLREHQWVSSHNCELHPPIRPTFAELQALDPWRWPVHSSMAFMTYESLQDQEDDRLHWRETWRSDGKRQYEVRAARLIQAFLPFHAKWIREYPNLSGVVLSDHGEAFPVIRNAKDVPVTHMSGIHGFSLDALTGTIPLHPFGATEDHLRNGDVFSLLDLRDAIGRWIFGHRPLELKGRSEGWLVQMPTIRPTHLETASAAMDSDPGRGIRPEQIAATLHFSADGFWYSDVPLGERDKSYPVCSAIYLGDRILLFNPVDSKTYYRQEIVHGVPGTPSLVPVEQMKREVAAFRGCRVVSNALD